MNGAIITGTPIAVDYWRSKNSSSKVFFLSHAHSDHTSGLSSTWRCPIYCSAVTGKIAVAKCGVKQSLIRPLSIGSGHIVPLDEMGKETMTVTLIDANHCPGAVMFLFEGYFGRFLYTGDFRYHPCMFSNSVLKLNRPLDKLYLDNTYNSPENDFPGEADCKVKIMEVLAEYPYTNVVLGMHQLGKEDLLIDIADFCGEQIQVSPERKSMIELLDCKDVFTTSDTRIRVEPVHAITMRALDIWNSEFPTIVIIPSAIFKSQRKSCIANHPNVFIVPYSSHSSYNELVLFVKQARPRKVIPIVQPSKKAEKTISDMNNFDQYIDKTPLTAVSIPPSVETYMNSSLSVGEMRPSLRKRHSMTDKRAAKCSAKGVVFEDVSYGDDLESNQIAKGNDTGKDDVEKCDETKSQTITENEKCSLWDASTHSRTNVFEQFERFKDKLSKEDTEKSTDVSRSPCVSKNNPDGEGQKHLTALQVCQETFYTKPKWLKQYRRKMSEHICEHAQAGKSCLCKFLVIKNKKENLIRDAVPGSNKNEQQMNSNNESLRNCHIEPPTRVFNVSDESSCEGTFHEGQRNLKRAPSILPADPRSMGNSHDRCYSAFLNFYKRVKTCSAEYK